jgi:arginine deiminase
VSAALCVEGEIGWLRRVMVCAPGDEMRRVPPAERDRYLMEDVLWLERAEEQHRAFTRALETVMRAGPAGPRAEVVDLRVELRRVLAEPRVAAATAELIERVGRLEPSLPRADRAAVVALLHELAGRADPALADRLIGGVLARTPTPGRPHFLLGPSPNVLFSRDYQFVLGGGVFISSMAMPVRRKEPLLSRFVFREALGLAESAFDVADVERLGPAVARELEAIPGELWIEGGDVMAVGRSTVLVGLSERTTLRGASALALALRHLHREDPTRFPFRELCAVELPSRRAMMHLDTVFTLVDEGLALAFPPLTFPGAREEMNVLACDLDVDPDAPLGWTWQGHFSQAMAARLSSPGRPLTLVAGGGPRRTLQHREQWFDGCNALAIGPGVAVLYRRNDGTLSSLRALDDPSLRDAGAIVTPGAERAPAAHLRPFRVRHAADLNDACARSTVAGGERLFVCIEGGELGRARGGPHCMSMALAREPEGSGADPAPR